MSTSPRRVLALALAALSALATLGLAVTPAHAAGMDIPVEVTISTPDGEPIDATMIVRLQSVLETGGSVYATPQDSAFVTADGSSSRLVELKAPTPGYYTISVATQGTTTRYLPTWLGGSGTAPQSMDDPNIFLIDETAQPSLGHEIELRQAQRVTGVVRGTNGQPLDNVTVESMKWEGGSLVSAGRDSLTGKDGKYSVAVPPGTEASLRVRNRVGYGTWYLGGGNGTAQTPDRTLVMDQDRTQDITLTPDWSNVDPSPRIVRDEACLTSSLGGTATVGSMTLDVSSKGYVVPKDTDYAVGANPLAVESDVAALVPYWTDIARPFTWGVADDRLCVVWRPSSADTMAYQLLLDADGTTTFNYGTIDGNIYSVPAQAGWTEGNTEDDELVVLPRDGYDGYADGADTALVDGSLGTDLPGRYTFSFPGFFADGDAAPVISPEDASAGDLLSVAFDVQPRALAGTTYQWLRDYQVVPGATGPTIQTAADDEGVRYTVRLVTTGDEPTVSRTGTTLQGSRPTADAPAIDGTPRPGRTLSVDPAEWSDDATTTGYQWFLDGEAIDDATDPTYRVAAGDVGGRLSVEQVAEVDGRGLGRAASDAVTVRAAASGTDSRALPDTGGPNLLWLGAGFALLLVGGAAVLWRSRR